MMSVGQHKLSAEGAKFLSPAPEGLGSESTIREPGGRYLGTWLPWNKTYPDVISKIKVNSSRFIRRTNRDFGWQEGYGAFVISMSQVETVVQYIRNQAEHHKRRSFEDEFILMLKMAKIEFDPATIFERMPPFGLESGACLPRPSGAGLRNSAPLALTVWRMVESGVCRN